MNDERSATLKPRPRIEAFSDLIFGLALSIGALTLISPEYTSFTQLMAALGLYAFSFLILVAVWRSYSTITSILPAETGTLTGLNILLLFLASIEPFLFNHLYSGEGSMFQGVSVVYAVDLAAMFLILAFFNHSLADEEKGRVPKEHLKRYRFNRNYDLTIAAMFLISILPFFGSVNVFQVIIEGIPIGISLRVFIWILALVSGWVRRLLEKSIDRDEKKPPSKQSGIST